MFNLWTEQSADFIEQTEYFIKTLIIHSVKNSNLLIERDSFSLITEPPSIHPPPYLNCNKQVPSPTNPTPPKIWNKNHIFIIYKVHIKIFILLQFHLLINICHFTINIIYHFLSLYVYTVYIRNMLIQYTSQCIF